MMSSPEPRHAAFARHMRHEPTEAERVLWLALRGRRFLAWKFRRQVPVGSYIADFLCFEARLVVEVDGGQHAESARDVERDRWFEANGYRVLRLWNHEVLTSKRAALDAVYAALSVVATEGGAMRKHRAPSSAPSGHLLPRGEKGEGSARSEDTTVASLAVDTTESALEGKRTHSPRAPSLLPSREKVAAKRSDEGARAAQPGHSAKRSDEGARAAQPGHCAQRSVDAVSAVEPNEINGRGMP